jgi:hypothetical protein
VQTTDPKMFLGKINFYVDVFNGLEVSIINALIALLKVYIKGLS